MDLVRTAYGVGVDRGGAGVLEVRHVIGIGRNYAAHAHEQGADVPTRPMVFTKNPASACLHGDDIVIPPVCGDADTEGNGGQVDFEAELAVVVGEPIRDASEEEALAAVLGVSCGNDVSARWWQKKGSGGQFCRGKSFDTFCPLGPRVVPVQQAGDLGNLRVVCRVNGEVMQDGNTSQMIFPVGRLLSDLSRGTTLVPGTVVLTGTPEGVGMARDPQVWLKDGDVVEVEVEGVGVLRNSVVQG